MLTKPRFTMMVVTVFMVIILSAMSTVPALADDSTPPPAEPTATEVTPVAEQEVAETPVAETEQPTEPAATTEESAPEESAPAETPSEEATTAELLAQVPEGTDVVVTDESGEPLPLASTEAAEAIEFVDPVWCPTGVTPQNGTGGCSASFASLSALITGFVPTGNGVIWIQSGADATPSGTALTIDGATNWAAAANYTLSLQGGWSGVMGTTTVNNETPSIFDQTLSIINWNANISLANIVIDGAVSNTVADNSALLIETNGNIQLTRVTVKNSQNGGGAAATNGATLDNSNSTTGSTINVNNGYFENNDGDGLHIYSAGMVTMANIFANGNDLGGAIVDNSFAATDQAVTLSGSQEYNNNGNTDGLVVISNGLVTLSNVTANSNGGNGVDIDNSSSLTNQGVNVNGSNRFFQNGIGLNVLSHGVITVSNLFASENGADGVHLNNCDDIGGCDVAGAPGVNVLGNNFFYFNTEDGLDILTYGQITTYNLTASDNIGNGAVLNNQMTSTALVDAAGGITLYGYNVFNNNGIDGLSVTSHGDFIAYGLAANNNGDNGVSLTVQKDQPTTKSYVTKKKVKVGKKYVYRNVTVYYTVTEANIYLYGNNTFNGNNTGDGLYASADGMITLYNVRADFNGANGADLTTTTQGYGVSLYGANYFTENGCACGAGLHVNSAGAVTLYNINADRNLGNGVDIDNTASTSGAGVTLYGSNIFNNNTIGLNVLSHGIITTYNLTATGNFGDGVHLDNCDDMGSGCTVSGAPYVYLVGNNYFYFNLEEGLDVSSYGRIIAYNLTASYNIGNGATLNNQTTSTALVDSVGTITLYGYNVFNSNDADGLNVASHDDFIAYGLTANNNLDNGVSVTVQKDQPTTKSYVTKKKVKVGKNYVYKNVTIYYTVTAANVYLYGDNNFNGNNTGNGLNVSADGAIVVYNLTANQNGLGGSASAGNGAVLDNYNYNYNCGVPGCPNTDISPVALYGFVNVSDNNWRGLEIYSPGAITLGNIIASGNLGVGVRIDNKYNASANSAGVTITGTNIFNGNDSTGLVVLSYGAIALNNINAYNNGDSTPGSTSGAVLDNTGGVAPKNITLTGLNSFVGNYFWGLQFASSGDVYIARISADGNDHAAPNAFDGGGVLGTAANITLTCGHMFGNGSDAGTFDPAPGYNLTATGILTLNGIYSAGNRGTDNAVGSSVIRTSACALP